MECMSEKLQPHKDVIGQIASIVTICQFFAGMLVCKTIYEKKSTKGVKALPFIGGVCIGALMLKLAYIMNDSAMFQVNIAAIILNTFYTAFYYQYSENKYGDILKPSAIASGFCALCLGYANWEDPGSIEFRYGLLMTVLMLLVLALPLADMKTIIDTKDASSIPFPITFMSTLVTLLWCLYGLAISNVFMVIQNIAGFVICALQLWLIFEYPGSGQNKKLKKKKQ